MSSIDDFDREVKALVSRGKLSSSAVSSLSELAMANIRADSQLVSALYRHHRKASPANKLVSLYLIDAIAREAKSRQKKAERDGTSKQSGPAAAGSTTPSDSPPRAAAAGPSAGDGDFASFLRKLEAVLSKIVLDNWEHGLPEHREKVRKVLDIWTRASTFGASALAKISSKLLAVSAAAAPVAQMSPGRPSLSPGPADTPPRDSTAPPAAAAGIPANVLALLQAKAPPSQAALEQKQHDDVESEVERALREAREGTSLATNPGVGSGPTSAALPPSNTPVFTGGQSPGVPFSQDQPPYTGATDAYASSASGRSYPPGGSGLVSGYDADRSSLSRGVANGGNGSASTPGYGSAHPPYQSGFPSHARQHSGDDRRGDFDSRAASSSTSYRPHDLYGGAGGPRGQTRSFEASQAGSGTPYAGRPEEPPTKRPYQPQPQQESSSSSSLFSPSTHAAVGVGGYGPAAAAVPPASASSFSGGSTPQQQRPQHSTASTASSSRLRPPDVGVAPGEGGGAGAGGGPGALDPTTFDATSPASWSTFVNVLRTSHPYFVSLGRMPTLEEVMGLCAPSAMMAFGPGGGTAPPNAAATSRMMTMMTTAMQPGPGAGGPGQAMMGAGGTRGGGMGPGAPPY